MNVKNLYYQIENIKECNSIKDIIQTGHYIGSIDKIIDEIIYKNNEIDKFKINMNLYDDDKLAYNVFKYKNEIPLIVDSMKKYFSLIKNNYVIANIKNERYLIYRSHNHISVEDYLKVNSIKYIIDSVRDIFAFNWFMCVKNGVCLSYEKNIKIRTFNPLITNIGECTLSLLPYTIGETGYISDINKDIISPTILNKWFDGKLETFYKVARRLLEGIDADAFRNYLEEIINFYNKDYISWVNNVYNRVKFIKSCL
jgi:hypothetical protein